MNLLPNCSVATFGSYARRDNDSHSDRDVLVVFPSQQFPSLGLKQLESAGASCSTYSRPRLSRMAKDGSLFIKHLVNESHVLQDSDGFLKSLLAQFSPKLNYTDVFDDALRVFGLVEYIPQHVDGVSWAIDIVAVGFRAMAIPFLADRGMFVFGMGDICEGLVRLGRLKAGDVAHLAILRQLKSAYRRCGKTGCTSQQLAELISIVDRCFRIGVQPRFRSQEEMIAELEQNSPNEWYRGLRLLEATLLTFSSIDDARIIPIQKMIRSPQAYGWQMKRHHRDIVHLVADLSRERSR